MESKQTNPENPRRGVAVLVALGRIARLIGFALEASDWWQ